MSAQAANPSIERTLDPRNTNLAVVLERKVACSEFVALSPVPCTFALLEVAS